MCAAWCLVYRSVPLVLSRGVRPSSSSATIKKMVYRSPSVRLRTLWHSGQSVTAGERWGVAPNRSGSRLFYRGASRCSPPLAQRTPTSVACSLAPPTSTLPPRWASTRAGRLKPLHLSGPATANSRSAPPHTTRTRPAPGPPRTPAAPPGPPPSLCGKSKNGSARRTPPGRGHGV